MFLRTQVKKNLVDKKKYLFLLIFLSACTSEKYHKISIDEILINKEATYVGSESCRSCHKEEYGSWKKSHHAQAMKVADSTSVLGNFQNIHHEENNLKSFFFRKGKDYYVNTEGPDGNYYDYKIVYTFGITPLQQYIVKLEDGAYQCLQIAWNTMEKKWFNLQPTLEIKHTEWLHWSRGGMRWNAMCADCHSTNLHKNFDTKTNTYTTTYSEINVSCEACHGPSSLHVGYYQKKTNDSNPPKMEMGISLSSKTLVDQCARCHSRRSQLTQYFDHQGSFLDHYNPSLLIDPLYEPDGQIKDEVYVYGSFAQSKMYQNGVSCKDCHDVHSLALKKTGNALCLDCHSPNYNTYDHHFHVNNSEGSLCINCHMGGTYYMVNDFRRDHSFRIPRPDQTVKYNTPNTCNGCHQEKTAEWASNVIKQKYGDTRKDHFSDHLLSGYYGDSRSYYKILENTQYPEIVRATALRQYVNQLLYPDEVKTLSKFLKDSSILVKNETVQAYKTMIGELPTNNLNSVLNDSIRLLRISAIQYVNAKGIAVDSLGSFDKAHQEYLDYIDMNSDFPGGQHEKALYYQNIGKIDLAIKAYKKAIEIDNYYNMSRMNLALLLYQQGAVAEAKNLYEKVIEQEPEYSQSYHMLGLLYNESGNIKKALGYLSMACERKPVDQRSFYNYALLLQKVGNFGESIAVLRKALQSFPNNEELMYIKLIGELNTNDYANAYNTCTRLAEIAPHNRTYKQMLIEITKLTNIKLLEK